MRLVAWSIAACCGAWSMAQGQATTGTLTGTVTGTDERPVADAVVQARSDEHGALRTAVTDRGGNYTIASLRPGNWSLVARAADGRRSPVSAVTVRLQETLRVDFLVAASLEERVEVAAERPLIDPRETAGRLRVSGDQADTLPTAARNVTDLALLDSAVQAAPPGTFVGERASVFTVNGQSGRSNSFLIDGLDNNDQISGTTQNSFYSQLVIDEFVLLKNQYAPEFGRASGGVMNVLTRSGSNELQWDGFVQGSSYRWNGPGEFVSELPREPDSQDSSSGLLGGFRLGGPIARDRTFYFLAYEHQQIDEAVPFVGIDREGRPGGVFLAPNRNDNLFLRTDFNLSASNALMVRLSYNDRTTSGVNVGGVQTPEYGFTIDERDSDLAATLTTILSPRLVNEVRLLAASSSFDQRANSSRPGVARPSGLFGGNNLNYQLRDETRLALVENVSYRAGDHTLKVGVDVIASRTDLDARFNPNGNFIYNSDLPFEPGDCGNLFLDDVFEAERLGTLPLVDCPGQIDVDDDGDGEFNESGNLDSYPVVFTLLFGQPTAILDNTNFALFVQDHWQAGKRWVLDYGLRYDVSTYELPESARVDSTVPNGGATRDLNNVAPRVGFAFRPYDDGRMVLRGGAGMFYDKLVLGFPAVAAVTSGAKIGLSFPQGFAFEITEQFVEDHGIAATIPELLLDNPFLDELIMQFSTAAELETPYTVQANLGLDLRLGRSSALSFNAMHNRGYHTPLMVDLNPVSGLRPVGVDCRPENLDPELEVGLPCHLKDPTTGSIAAITTDGRSWYAAAGVDFRVIGARSWSSVSYTLSKAEDLGFDPLKGGIALPPDSDDIDGERARADADRRHRFVWSGDTDLPWAGLRMSGVLQLSSGLPFNVTTGTDDNLDGILSDRPAGVGRNSGEDTPLAPVNALRAEHGLPPVESLDEPSFAQLDLRIYRPFSWRTERGRGEVYLQVINLFDRENGGLVEGRVASLNFGRVITLAGPPRTLEFGFRIGY
ncbi:MAG TPA: TonB-dependent receptor [Candidatus Polarisedimenticolaceae bacterium]|nr:TonB-dependent receptor [Candidatus Polarisedimenticolaceae bacterium]